MRRFVRSWIVVAFAWQTATATADVAWHADGWSHRALAEVTQPGDADVDVASMWLIHCGLLQEGADDLRVYSVDGQAVPYEIAYHHPKRDTLLLLRGVPGDRLAVYFGNADASADSLRAVRPSLIGAGPPRAGPEANGWIPRAGLVLTTMRRPRESPNPMSVDEMRTLIASSPGPDGAGLVPTVSHGLNPFGDSDHYLSIYRGWLRLPSTGAWGFCTASNEASFSFIDGRDLVHWPGRHTEQRGRFGEKSANHNLQAGLHYVEYVHEEVLLYQTAFLGWRPPRADRFDAIPASAWPRPHTASVMRYETADGRTTLMPRAELLDSVWPPDRSRGQYTRYRFTAMGDPADVVDIVWQFGDGITATGRQAEHIFTRTASYSVILKIKRDRSEQQTYSFPLTVFPIEHLEAPFREGDPATYRERMAAYDPSSMAMDGVVELAWFYSSFGDADRSSAVAKAAMPRAKREGPSYAELNWLAAGDAGTSQWWWSRKPDSDQADATPLLRAAIEASDDPALKLAAIERLIRLTAAAGDGPQTIAALRAMADPMATAPDAPPSARRHLREVLIAVGDVQLVTGTASDAANQYKLAEAMSEPPVPANVRAAKVGAFPELLEQAMADRDWAAAEATLGEWMQRFPADMATGAPLFHLGKLAMRRDRPGEAIRPLEVAIRVGRGSEFEAEARYLLAHAFRQVGDDAACRQTLQALIETSLGGPWRLRALKELEAR